MITFALASLVLVMLPGPDQALITRNALVGGRRAGLLTALGGVLGTTVHATTAALGLSALLVASSTAFTTLKVVGVAYLVWLGIQMLRSGTRTHDPDEGTAAGVAGRRALRQGLLSNALNPKVALFFVTFLPQFLASDSASPTAQALLLSAIFAAVYLAWFGLYVVLVDHLGRWLRRPLVRSRIEQVTGGVLLLGAGRLAL